MLTYVCGLSRGVGAPRDTAHMRQHGKLEISDARTLDFSAFWGKI